ncbi:hypothetical protein ES332_A12G044000v1 [Gossypium tomentosum]|uniref:Uncharacterized protein n=1 Tax=Gossypium tomentosum TaxID=34277 RepID=A0A5D2MT86_GOSTO|nr:hypothetical protein ES332_A12G044000v1 [Gossypium tomentosum]
MQTNCEVDFFSTMENDPEMILLGKEDHLSYWEFVNSSDYDDDDDDDDDDSGDVISVSDDDSLSSPKDTLTPRLIQGYACDGDGEQEVDDGDDDLDDELVPRAFSGKLGMQRMRKLGKRVFAKMHTSKKSPFLYMKPGCVCGKHGLGFKYSF